MSIKHLEQKVQNIVKNDVMDKTDRAWVVAVYVSLRAAEELGYKQDDFVRLPWPDQRAALLRVILQGILSPPSTSDYTDIYYRGHFYNNALFRMVALAETRLDILWRKHHPDKKLHSRSKWKEELNWYVSHFGEPLEYLHKVRLEINKFKHEDTTKEGIREFETMQDATTAFEELLSLLSKVSL